MVAVARALAALGLTIAMLGCSSLPQVERTVSQARIDTGNTHLARLFAPALAAHPGQSGFHLLEQGADAFLARVGLVRAAQRTLDLQYYIFHADDTGLALLGELLDAAERGVRVRLLLDDLAGPDLGEALAAVDAHPNLEVRVFNPFARRNARWLDFVTDFGRVNRRMHNKSLTADSAASIVGGRNVGDEYFGARQDLDFSDLDVLAVGPAAGEVQAEFDRYWNNAVVYPLASLDAPAAPEAVQRVRAQLHDHAAKMRASPYGGSLLDTDLAKAILSGKLQAHWGRATLIADLPEKVMQPAQDQSTHAIPKLGALLRGAQRELILVSPYFVPGKEGTAWLLQVAARGVRVRIVTNSFAASDVRAVHAGYSAYRKELLAGGIELYELKPTANQAKRHWTGSSHASLHAKTYMVDRRQLFVGSLNLDPRSARLNTEMGLVLESAEMCARLAENFERQGPENAWQVRLEANGELSWTSRDGRLDEEPGMSFLQRGLQGLLRLLPVEDQL
jgi:putative cardiolipin synthase